MQPLADYRESLRSTLQAVSSSDDDQIVDAAKMVLGTDDEQIVLSAFAPMGHFLRDKFGEGNKAAEIADKMDRFWRRTFGVRRGFLNQTLAEIKANHTKTSASTKMHAQAELLQTVRTGPQPSARGGRAVLPRLGVARMDPERNRFFWWKMGPDGRTGSVRTCNTVAKSNRQRGLCEPGNRSETRQGRRPVHRKLRVLGESEQDRGILRLLRQGLHPQRADARG